jgi:hypothetical protein
MCDPRLYNAEFQVSGLSEYETELSVRDSKGKLVAEDLEAAFEHLMRD